MNPSDRLPPGTVHSDHLERMVDYYEMTGSRYNVWHCNPADSSSHNYGVRELLRMMRRVKGRSVLDVCCGTGRGVKAALDQGYLATGIDISPKLIEIAKTDLGIPAENLVVGDAAALPFPDESFDVCCIFGALHHTAIPEVLIDEMIRVSRLGIVVSDEANRLHGGLKQLLIALRIFDPVYRLLFRRAPRTSRRVMESEGDGPTFSFSIEEIIPRLKSHFKEFQSLTFYKVAGRQFCSYRFPRLFATQAVVSVSGKLSHAGSGRG